MDNHKKRAVIASGTAGLVAVLPVCIGMLFDGINAPDLLGFASGYIVGGELLISLILILGVPLAAAAIVYEIYDSADDCEC